MPANNQLELFRLKTGLLIQQHVDRMKIMLTENKITGLSTKAIKETKNDELSRWALERQRLNKAIKKEVAGLINKIHQAAYMEGFK